MNKEKYFQIINNYNELIKKEEKKIQEIKNNIYKLQNDLDKHIGSCKHKNDDGSSALKEISSWVSSPYDYTDDWTGETESGDNGYSEHYEECKICGQTIY